MDLGFVDLGFGDLGFRDFWFGDLGFRVHVRILQGVFNIRVYIYIYLYIYDTVTSPETKIHLTGDY